MLTHPLINQMRELKLFGMLEAFEGLKQLPDADTLGFEDRLSILIEKEKTCREQRKLQARLKKAKLRLSACMEDIDYRTSRGLDKSLLRELAQGDWITRKRNLAIIGPTGTGKSYLACALAHKACLLGFNAQFTKLSRVLEQFSLARAEGKYAKLLKDFCKIDLLVLDDWGSSPLNDQHRQDLLELLDDRYDRLSTIVTSQYDIKHWHKLIGDTTLADAILDRLVHNAYKFIIKGDSMRKIRAKDINTKEVKSQEK